MKNILLIGFMGTGKSTTGRILAARLRWPFVDMDRRLERETGVTIAELFGQKGLEEFQKMEYDLALRLSRYKGSIIATGGSIAANPNCLTCLRRNGVMVLLTASVDKIQARTSYREDLRPLLAVADKRSTIEVLLSKWEPVYAQAELKINTEGCSPAQVAERIVSYMREQEYLRGIR